MTKGFEQLRISSRDNEGAELNAPPGGGLRGIAPGGGPPGQAFENDSQAARFYLASLLGRQQRPVMRGFAPAGPPTSTVVDGLEGFAESAKAEEGLAITGTKLLSFEQRKNNIPVFGTRAVVELDADRQFVSASVSVADVDQIGTQPQLSAEQAAERLAEQISADSNQLPAPKLTILPVPGQDDKICCWHFHGVNQAPPVDAKYDRPPVEPKTSQCCDVDIRPIEPNYDYFIDGDSGELAYFFSNQPHVEVPTWCRGQDESGVVQTFFGHSSAAGYQMDNRFEDIRTYDLQLNLIEVSPVPATPVQNASNNWLAQNPAAVSAQVNASRVMDFLFGVLRRDSIDDNGMALENIVNCVSNDVPQADRPQWINAVWWQGKMWYGQKQVPGGGFESLARYLDIIAHELTHGVTENTAGLIYRDLPGALNESFSDIFGVIINNWYTAPDRNDVGTWSWLLGPDLNGPGVPLRDMQDPSSVGSWWRPTGSGWQQVAGYPDHMNDYVNLPDFYDHGGVHIFSNIHNKAAFNLLTSTNPAGGARTFAPQEVAVLYYLTLARLTPLSDFSDARSELISVANILYGGSPARNTEVVNAISDAYDAVGIN